MTTIVLCFRVSDPRSAPAAQAPPVTAAPVTDPRMRLQDPRAAPSQLPDPRGNHLPDPRNPAMVAPRPASHEPLQMPQLPMPPRVADPRVAGSVPSPHTTNSNCLATPPPVVAAAPIQRHVPEIDGKYTRPIEFNLIPVYVEIRTSYIPPGAENSPEMLRDPRIKKRVLSMKKESPPALPSLPDITADLARITNAISHSAPPLAVARQTSRLSKDSLSDPRRNSIENKYSFKGQGDQNSNNESVLENGTKLRNSTRTALSKVHPMATGNSAAAQLAAPATSYDDDEEEDNSLTIDIQEDESKQLAAV